MNRRDARMYGISSHRSLLAHFVGIEIRVGNHTHGLGGSVFSDCLPRGPLGCNRVQP